MNKSLAAVLATLFISASATLCGAGAKKDHICFRVLDANQDGYVTFQEFEQFYGKDEKKFQEADVDMDGRLTHREYHGILGHGS